MIFDLLGALFGGGKKSGESVRRDRYGHDREQGGGPRVKNGPNGGLLRARNKGGEWRGKHRFKK
jgi:hypothetical protein